MLGMAVPYGFVKLIDYLETVLNRMFALYEMVRDVRVDPVYLNMDPLDAIRDELNRTMSNRVMLNVGLCMVLWDIKSVGTGIVFPGDGGVVSKVCFRYVVFRPFHDEIVLGKIKYCTPEGVHVTLGFFDDILIPPEGLQHPSRFDEKEQIWIWEYATDGEETHDMYMDKGETIRFRIVAESFTDTTPIPQATAATAGTSATSGSTPALPPPEEPAANRTPYVITGTINEPGLGLLSWWN